MHINAFIYLLVYLTWNVRVCVCVCVCARVCMYAPHDGELELDGGRRGKVLLCGWPSRTRRLWFHGFCPAFSHCSGRLTSGPTALRAFGVHSSERLCSSQPLRFILPKLQGNYGNAPFEAGLISLYFLLPDKADLPCLWWAFFFFFILPPFPFPLSFFSDNY